MKTLALACVVVCVTAACGNRGSAVLPLEVTREFEEAFASKDAARTAALFTSDAQIFQQDRPAVERDEIEEYLAEQMDPIIMFDATTEHSFARGDLGVEVGSYTFRDTRRGSDIEYGKYIHIWRKENGQWKLFRTMYSTDQPLGGEVSVVPAAE